MATAWKLTGTNQLIASLDITASGTSDSFDINDKQAYSVLGGIFRVTGTNASTCTVAIGAQTIATFASLQMGAAASYGLELSDTASHMSGAAGDKITITKNAAHAGVLQLFISQAKPETLS